MTSEMAEGNLFVCESCPVLIDEIQQYVWDKKLGEKGEDAPLKQNDHNVDALRYAVFTHKVTPYNPYKHNPIQYMSNRFKSNF